MIDKKVDRIAKDIKALKIQGASNIELTSINVIIEYLKKTKKKSKQLIAELKENIVHLTKQRPNEPKLRNSMNFIYKITIENIDDKKKIIELIEKHKQETKKGNKKIAELASKLITNDSKILTHCHSHLVIACLKKAYDAGIKFEVFCTETRPRYQGRITAKSLSEHGIKTTMIVDGAVTNVLKKINYFLTGADVVFSDGAIMNKVGTHLISIAAKEFKTPHIVLTSTNSVEIDDLLGFVQDIEERDHDEIWEKKKRPKKLNIKNPSFDIIPSELVSKIVTEEGVFSPETLSFWINKFRKEI